MSPFNVNIDNESKQTKKAPLIHYCKYPQSLVKMLLMWLLALQLLLEILTSLYHAKFRSALLNQMVMWHGLMLASAAPSISQKGRFWGAVGQGRTGDGGAGKSEQL